MQRKENENGGSTIRFFGLTYGDAFPSNETFITDKYGTGVLLGVSGADELGPELMLPGNNNRMMAFFNIDVNFSCEGEIISVGTKGKTYSVNDWNNLFKTQDEKKGGSTNTDSIDKNN